MFQWNLLLSYSGYTDVSEESDTVIKVAGSFEMLVPIHRTTKLHSPEERETGLNPFRAIVFSE
jgi:hypothetical protein